MAKDHIKLIADNRKALFDYFVEERFEAGMVLTGTEVATFSNYTTNLARLPAVLTNQMAGRQFQFEDFQEYVIRETAIDNEFQQIYNGGMVNAQTLIEKAGDDNKIYRGIARVLKVMNIGLATDFWGDVPYSQALKGIENSLGGLLGTAFGRG